jgi:hypothetical protein
MPRILLSVPAAIAAVVLAAGVHTYLHADGSIQSQVQNSRTVVVSVHDKQGAPVPGITPADVRVRENGRNMTVAGATTHRTAQVKA